MASVVGRGVVECNGADVYTGDALTAMTYGISAARTRHQACVVRLTGTPKGDVTQYISAEGRPSRRPPAGTSGLGQSVLTEYACSESALNANWLARQQGTISAAKQASAVAGALVGAAGAFAAEQNPFFGALGGAAVAFGVAQIWLAPHSA
jgi:hypothetical protein